MSELNTRNRCHKTVLLVGVPGSGKSTLLRRLLLLSNFKIPLFIFGTNPDDFRFFLASFPRTAHFIKVSNMRTVLNTLEQHLDKLSHSTILLDDLSPDPRQMVLFRSFLSIYISKYAIDLYANVHNIQSLGLRHFLRCINQIMVPLDPSNQQFYAFLKHQLSMRSDFVWPTTAVAGLYIFNVRTGGGGNDIRVYFDPPSLASGMTPPSHIRHLVQFLQTVLPDTLLNSSTLELTLHESRDDRAPRRVHLWDFAEKLVHSSEESREIALSRLSDRYGVTVPRCIIDSPS